MTFWKRKKYRKKVESGSWHKEEIDRKGIWGNFGGEGDGNVLYLDFDGAFMTVYICHTSLNYTLENWILLYTKYTSINLTFYYTPENSDINYTSINLIFKAVPCGFKSQFFPSQWHGTALYLLAIHSPSLENCLFTPLQSCLPSLRIFLINLPDLEYCLS